MMFDPFGCPRRGGAAGPAADRAEEGRQRLVHVKDRLHSAFNLSFNHIYYLKKVVRRDLATLSSWFTVSCFWYLRWLVVGVVLRNGKYLSLLLMFVCCGRVLCCGLTGGGEEHSRYLSDCV